MREGALVFKEFYRVVKAPGWLVFSMEHPYTKYEIHRETSNYFEVEAVEYEWNGFGEPVRVPSYRRPLSAVINPLVRAGFAVDELLEPTPTEAFRQADPEDYEALSREPGFMCVRAVKA